GLALEEDVEGVNRVRVGLLLSQLLLRLQVGLEHPGLLSLGCIKIDVYAVLRPVAGTLLENQRKEHEGQAIVVGKREAGSLKCIAVPDSQFLRSGHNLIPGLEI